MPDPIQDNPSQEHPSQEHPISAACADPPAAADDGSHADDSVVIRCLDEPVLCRDVTETSSLPHSLESSYESVPVQCAADALVVVAHVMMQEFGFRVRLFIKLTLFFANATQCQKLCEYNQNKKSVIKMETT